MIRVDDFPEIEAKIRTALRRAGVKRRVVEARMQRIVRTASTIMDPRMSLLNVAATGSVADLYAALLMVAVSDTFRDGEQPGISATSSSSQKRMWCCSNVYLYYCTSAISASLRTHLRRTAADYQRWGIRTI